MANIIPFARHRFMPGDLDAFNQIAFCKLKRGIWDRIERHTDSDKDEIRAYFPKFDRPVFIFRRDKDGYYSLIYVDQMGESLIGQGWQAKCCLSTWDYNIKMQNNAN